MGFSCPICQATFGTSDDICSTKCGHVFHYPCLFQWLSSKLTCPQCRQNTSKNSVLRLYLHVSNDTIYEDASSLQDENDSLKFQLRLRDKDISDLSKEIRLSKSQAIKLRSEVGKLEQDVESRNTAITGLRQQAQYLKSIGEEAKKLKAEVTELRNKLKEVRNIEMLLSGTNDEVDEVISSIESPANCKVYILTLKRELTKSMDHRKDLRKLMKRLKDENHVLATENTTLAKKLDQAQIAVDALQQIDDTSAALKNRTESILKSQKITMQKDSMGESSKKANGESEDEENIPFANLVSNLRKKPASTAISGTFSSVNTKKPRLCLNSAFRDTEDIEHYAPDGHGGFSRVEQFPSGSGIRKKKTLSKPKTKNLQNISIKNFVDLTSP